MAVFLNIAIISLCGFMTTASPFDGNNNLDWHDCGRPCSWTEDRSPCDIILALQKSLTAVEGKMTEFVEQQYIIQRLTRKLELQGQEIHKLGKTLALLKGERSWELPPKAEPLTWLKDGNTNEIKDHSYSIGKFEDLLQQMQNLSSNVKGELEEERRMRRLLQEEVRILMLNSTHTLTSNDERLNNLNRTIHREKLLEDAPLKNHTESTERRLKHLEQELSLLRNYLSNSEEEAEEKKEEVVKEEMKELVVEEEKEEAKALVEEEESVFCPPLDYEESPGLIMSVSSGISKPGKTVFFSCSGDRILIGDAFTRCRTDATWSHSRLPRCLHPEEE